MLMKKALVLVQAKEEHPELTKQHIRKFFIIWSKLRQKYVVYIETEKNIRLILSLNVSSIHLEFAFIYFEINFWKVKKGEINLVLSPDSNT